MPEKQRQLNCLLVVLAKRNKQNIAIFLIVFNNNGSYTMATKPTKSLLQFLISNNTDDKMKIF